MLLCDHMIVVVVVYITIVLFEWCMNVGNTSGLSCVIVIGCDVGCDTTVGMMMVPLVCD